MKQVTLNIPDKKFPVFMELINSLDYIKKVETEDEPTKEEVLSGIKQAFKELEMIKSGKLKGRPIKDLLDEL